MTMTLNLRRLTVTASTSRGRPVVRLPSGHVVYLSLRQLAALVREHHFIAGHEATA